MGIPRLRQLLEPYAERNDLGDRKVVIDGPGLAYHIFNQCQTKASSGSLFDQPSYPVLGQAAIAWLDRLTGSGAVLEAIYFDGYLPASKEAERKRRLVDLSQGLRSYFSLYPSGVPQAASGSKRPAVSAVSRARKAPVPPFLVPAVLEALRGSEKYGGIIKLVPGEADSFCARHVHSAGGGVVITSDTDLLVHDLGPEGSVTFYNDIEFKVVAGKSEVMISEYSMWQACGRLSLPQEKGIMSLAFEISMDSHLTLKQAIQKSEDGVRQATLNQEYSRFMEQYLTPETAETSGILYGPFDGLDPRISELVLEILSATPRDMPPSASGAPDQLELEVPMYLPVLVDSPSRSSAWEVSTPVRAVAYGLMQLRESRTIHAVAEFRRIQQPTSKGTQVHILSGPALAKACTELNERIAHVQACVAEPELQWVALAIWQDIVVSQDNGKGSVLSLEQLQHVANASLSVTNWDFVHLFAQAQGLYYSIRMIQQICDFIVRHEALPESGEKLRKQFSDFPTLAEFPSFATFAGLWPRTRLAINLKELVAGLDLSAEVTNKIDSVLNPKQKKSKNKRKRGRKDTSQATAARPSPQSRNMFACLGSE